MPAAILLPAATLVAWSLIVWVWMLATRVPAMQKARIHPEKAKHTRSAVYDVLPSEVRQVADNYNHLMEQPTIFYAIVMVLAMSGESTMLDAGLAWAYVGLRIIHSIWQNTRNVVLTRFYLFIASTLVLFPMTGRAIYLLIT
jgi:hypothetical protein